MSRRNQVLAVLKYIYREIIATTTEVVSAIKVLIVHIKTLHSWLSVTGTVSINIGLASELSVIYTENQPCSFITQTQQFRFYM